MLVRAIRSRHRGRWIRVVTLATCTITASHTRSLNAQEASAATPSTHTVKRGDTLWDISKTYLGDPFLWPEIYRINTDIIQDPHWIYPGEVLKLPGASAKVIAVVAPPAPPAARNVEPAPMAAPAIAAAVATESPAQQALAAPRTTVRTGEYAASPWVDQRGGPPGAGYIMQAADLPGTVSADKSRMSLYDRVFVAPPAGGVAAEKVLYLAYKLGPMIEDFGQIVIPTGLVEITRSPRNGEAATGRVVKLFTEMLQGQQVIPYDSSASLVMGQPSSITNGHAGKVRWIYREPVLPSMQDYVVIDISNRDGVTTGDQIELYQPRQAPVEGAAFAIPEVSIAHGQVLRVTPFGATAIITAQEQPKIGNGTAARVAAKMP
ncbi:MAG: LysM peptidoglycan-binding domain-containing protein [bacterium]